MVGHDAEAKNWTFSVKNQDLVANDFGKMGFRRPATPISCANGQRYDVALAVEDLGRQVVLPSILHGSIVYRKYWCAS